VKIKRFFAKDMRSALAEVKETLGSDAVIMSNKKVTGGIEIVAAIDYGKSSAPAESAMRQLADDSVNLSSRRPKSDAQTPARQEQKSDRSQDFDENASLKDNLASFLKRHQQSQQATPPRESPRSPRSIAQQPGWKDTPLTSPRPLASLNSSRPVPKDPNTQAIESMKAEMVAMRKLLEHQVSGLMWQEVERQEPMRAMLIKELKHIGFSEPLADQLASLIPDDIEPSMAWEQVKQLLASQIEVGNDDILRNGGAVALLGPTGVGKTTTIAKLAAQFAKRHGAEQVAMITTDTYRIGAHEQLATYGKIMGCAVRVARDDEELSELLYQFREKRLVLIDTAGMSQRDIRLHEQLDTLVKNTRVSIQNYLVMSANAQRRVIEETVQQFERIPLAGTIFTKLDESLSLGEVLDVTLTHALPISYITNGQRVPEDIHTAQASELVEQALGVSGQTPSSYYWMSETQEEQVRDVK
jgi:flagellar biosynthesis protein FlhF